MKRFAKILSIALSAVLLLGALSVSAGAAAYDGLTPWFFGELDEGDSYTIQNAEKLLVVNDWIWSEDRTGSFTIQTAGSASQDAQLARDELTGEDAPQWREIQPDLPETIGRSDAPAQEGGGALYSQSGTRYALNDTLTLKGAINGGERERDVDMVCLYAGTYCTVWGTTSDAEEIQIGPMQAEKIGAYFDEKYPTMKATFGGDHEDADGDGRVAIMCYDIDKNYKAGESFYKQFTAGFFDMKDMIARNSKDRPAIGSVIFGESAAYPYNGIDCIRIDTYPLMGNTPDTLLDDVEACYSTLFHEFQHMLNFSSGLHHFEAGKTDELYYMDTFLNEAFSMAAEHLICTSKSTASRIRRFNGSDYKPGSSLTTWTGTLDNYANSYLFGQYLRTRWKQCEIADDKELGSDFYQTVYDWCVDPTDPNGKPIYDEEGNQIRYNGNAMGIIASLLGTNQFSLTVDFWTAVCLKQSSDIYGFAGEDWADAIEMQTNPLALGESNGGIASSGAKLYQLDPNKTYTITAAENCTIVAMTRAHGTCGENLTWDLSPDGALYIEPASDEIGDGGLSITSAPWQDLPDGTQITCVRLPAGLTSIATNAFAGLGTLDYVAFEGTVAEWQAINFGNDNDAVQNAACKYFDSDFVRMYWYDAGDDFVSLHLITEDETVGFAAARFDDDGRFIDYEYIAPAAPDDTTDEGEYGGFAEFYLSGAHHFSIMAFYENGCPIDSARTFLHP